MKRILASLLACSALLSPPSMSDESGDAMIKACPNLAAWESKHPHQGDEAKASIDSHRRFLQPALQQRLVARVAADQKARQTWMDSGMRDESASKAVLAVDADNLPWLKTQIAAHGFPTVAQVGEVGVSDAFLLVQHADRDSAFQTRVLQLLQEGTGSDVPKPDIALLTDRVLAAQGKPQRYASQFVLAGNGKMVLKPTEDLAHVDQRRAAMDLMPLDTYRCMMRVAYSPAAPTSKPTR